MRWRSKSALRLRLRSFASQGATGADLKVRRMVLGRMVYGAGVRVRGS